jgi:hypothetical protein
VTQVAIIRSYQLAAERSWTVARQGVRRNTRFGHSVGRLLLPPLEYLVASRIRDWIIRKAARRACGTMGEQCAESYGVSARRN